MKEELRTAYGRILSYNEKQDKDNNGNIILKRKFVIEKDLCGMPIKIEITNSNFFDIFINKSIRNPESFRSNIEKNWENLKLFFSFRAGEEIGVFYSVREIGGKEKNIFRQFFTTKGHYDRYIANTSNFVSQAYLTEFQDVVHLLKYFSHIALNSKHNLSVEFFEKIKKEKDRQVIMEAIKKITPQEKENFFNTIELLIENIEYSQEVVSSLYMQVKGVNDKDSNNRKMGLLESGNYKAMFYYLLTMLKQGFDDVCK